MANHKWEDESVSKFHKTERCTKCGVYRDWIGRDMQCWEYWHPDYVKNEKIKRHKFTRPECIDTKTKTTKEK